MRGKGVGERGKERTVERSVRGSGGRAWEGVGGHGWDAGRGSNRAAREWKEGEKKEVGRSVGERRCCGKFTA